MDFQKDVIERSHQIPVLVDFWAAWCGPCRMLGPTLDALAEEQAGRWELVKVDTEAHQDIAQQYRIQSIPNVKLFFQGQVVNEFAGALSKPMVANWLDANIPNPEARAFMELLATAGPWPDAVLAEKLESFVLEHPERNDAKVELAKQILASNPAAAKALAAEVPMHDRYYDAAKDVLALADWLEIESNGTPASALLAESAENFKKGEQETALQLLIKAISTDKSYRDGLARKATVALFRLLGENHPLTTGYRRRFSMALN